MRRGYGSSQRDHSSPDDPCAAAEDKKSCQWHDFPRQGSISERLPMCMREQHEMDTCLRRYLRSWEFALPIRLRTPCRILSLCSHRSRIRCRSGCGVRDRMGFAGDSTVLARP